MSSKQQQSDSSAQVNFGYQKVSAAEKTERVGAVFRAVAKRYDVDYVEFAQSSAATEATDDAHPGQC